MNNNIIYPGETSQVAYWTKKLGITKAQLHEAIMATGSLRVQDIKDYLKKKKFTFSFSGIRNYLKLYLSF
jgi:hypothetical protein